MAFHQPCRTWCPTGECANRFQNKEREREKTKQVPISWSRQDTLSLPVSTRAPPRRETMKGNNNGLVSWQFTACWPDTSNSAVFAEIKTRCFHVGFKTRSRALIPAPWPTSAHLIFNTRLQQSIYTISARFARFASCYRRSYRSGVSLQWESVDKGLIVENMGIFLFVSEITVEPFDIVMNTNFLLHLEFTQ